MAGRTFAVLARRAADLRPVRRYQVRFQLHGGVGRPEPALRGSGSIGALAGAEQIYVLPAAWDEAPWWDDAQIENLRVILDTVKRTYNVDENRVVVSGVSDGGTGAYYIAMRDTTPYASFLPLNGFIMVLANPSIGIREQLFPNNLRNKPFFVVNGGRDPLYPTSIVDPYVRHLQGGGVALTYRPQPEGQHNTAWWPEVKDHVRAVRPRPSARPVPGDADLGSGRSRCRGPSRVEGALASHRSPPVRRGRRGAAARSERGRRHARRPTSACGRPACGSLR